MVSPVNLRDLISSSDWRNLALRTLSASVEGDAGYGAWPGAGEALVALTNIIDRKLRLSETIASWCLEKVPPSLSHPRCAGTKECSALRVELVAEEPVPALATWCRPLWLTMKILSVLLTGSSPGLTCVGPDISTLSAKGARESHSYELRERD